MGGRGARSRTDSMSGGGQAAYGARHSAGGCRRRMAKALHVSVHREAMARVRGRTLYGCTRMRPLACSIDCQYGSTTVRRAAKRQDEVCRMQLGCSYVRLCIGMATRLAALPQSWRQCPGPRA